jgi:hypothetical protein
MPSDNVPLDRIRKLLAKAEAHGTTAAEAEALTGKAAELMARYGIDRALLAAARPETDQPADRIITIGNPWATVQAHLLVGIATAMRCTCIRVGDAASGVRIHIFGYASDVERAEMLYTSVLVQMQYGLAAATVPEWARSVRAWRRSWMLGFGTAVTGRVRAAEKQATAEATAAPAESGAQSAAVVLASREQVIAGRARAAYPRTRTSRLSYTGTGYRDGYAKGTQADIGTTRLTPRPRPGLR